MLLFHQKRTIEKLKDKLDRETEKFNKERLDRETEVSLCSMYFVLDCPKVGRVGMQFTVPGISPQNRVK